jgi:molybdate transport system ATP-binding protein
MIQIRLEKTLKAGENGLKIDVEFTIQQGMFACLYGPSGAGKTSTLRMISGLLQPDRGFINTPKNLWLDSDNNISTNPKNRNIGYVFQDAALFPNMTVLENLEYALTSETDTKYLHELIELTKLDELCHRKPNTL